MRDIVSVLKAWLEETGVAYEMFDGAVRFDLPFGSTGYQCSVWPESQNVIGITTLWHGSVPLDKIGFAQRLLSQMIEAGDGSGKTLLNTRTGELIRSVSVDISTIELTPEKLEMTVEETLDPFNVKVLALRMVLESKMTASQAIESYADWEKKRTDGRMAKLRSLCGTGALGRFDPTLNR